LRTTQTAEYYQSDILNMIGLKFNSDFKMNTFIRKEMLNIP